VKALAAMVLTVGCLGCRNGEADATLEGCRKVRDPAEARREANRILGMELDQALRKLEGDYRLVWSNAWIPDGCFSPRTIHFEDIETIQGTSTICDEYFEIAMNCRVTLPGGQGTLCLVSSIQMRENSPADRINLQASVTSADTVLGVSLTQIGLSSDRPNRYGGVYTCDEEVGFISQSDRECTGTDGCCPPMGDRIQ
jgi:hypothetical protein